MKLSNRKKNSIFNQLNYPGDLGTIKGETNAEKQNKTIKGFEAVRPFLFAELMEDEECSKTGGMT